MTQPAAAGGRDPASSIGRNIEAFLLLELLREPSYGYELVRRMADYGFRRVPNEPATVYRLLRALEENGAIASRWDTEGSGPARRYYQITQPGIALLHERAGHLERLRGRIDRFFEHYDAIPPQNGVPGPAGPGGEA